MRRARFGDGVGGDMLRNAQGPRRRNLLGPGQLVKYQNVIGTGRKRGIQSALIRAYGRGNPHAHEI